MALVWYLATVVICYMIWVPFPRGKEAPFSTYAFFPAMTWCLRLWDSALQRSLNLAFIKWTHGMKYNRSCMWTSLQYVNRTGWNCSIKVTNELAFLCIARNVYSFAGKVLHCPLSHACLLIYHCLHVHAWHVSAVEAQYIHYMGWVEAVPLCSSGLSIGLYCYSWHSLHLHTTDVLYPPFFLHYRCACTVFTGSSRRWDLSVPVQTEFHV